MASITEILNADLHEIVSMHLKRHDRASFEGFYVSLMKHYFMNDVEALEKLLGRIASASSLQEEQKMLLLVLGKGRLAARTGVAGEREIEFLREALPKSGKMSGEVWYVIALCFESMDHSREMSDAYLKAAQELKAIGAHAKSVKAMFNHIAAEHRLHPRKKFLADYQFIYREAKKHKVHSTAAMALVNISREYQLMGGLELALKHVNRALALLDRQKFARSFFLALAHRSHILLELGRTADAYADFCEAQICSFPDVQTAIASLKAIFAGASEPAVKPALRSWEGRVLEINGAQGKQKLGALEQRLLQFLSEKSRTRWEMIEFLYGTKLRSEVLENRFNNTLQRLKKKLPGVIVNSNGKFSLSEAVFGDFYKKNA